MYTVRAIGNVAAFDYNYLMPLSLNFDRSCLFALIPSDRFHDTMEADTYYYIAR